MKLENPDHRQPRLLSDQRRLGLAPAPWGGFVETAGIVIDSKSGTTEPGAASQTTHFPDSQRGLLGL